MPVSLWATETRYVANEVSILRGQVSDIIRVGVYHNVDPGTVPTPAEFTTVDLVDPPDPLAEGAKIDVLSLIGPDVLAHLLLPAGVHQRWVLIETNTEKMIFKVDLVTVTA